LTAEDTDEDIAFRITVLDFEPVLYRIVVGTFEDLPDGGAFDQVHHLVFDLGFGKVLQPGRLPPETTLSTVRTTTILIISPMLRYLSNRLGSDLVDQRIYQIDQKNCEDHAIHVGADIADQHGHDTA
jgi:hypothetical protein